VEDLDDENHLVIKESQLENLKARLDHVCSPLRALMPIFLESQTHGYSNQRTNTAAGS
jgi:hypothetical protein